MVRPPLHHDPFVARTPLRPAAVPSRALASGHPPPAFFPELEHPLSLVTTQRFSAAAAGPARATGTSRPAG
ncbi:MULTISPECIES: hypothetical protein [Modicisalibacter]|uniref:Uncharacterized protein n=1 Tax=Modicisalibacter tunisiensis TaxID=390637 RepID=A0ABS7X1Y5_9GAMM|nr:MULTISPECIES: hypothetical protein [Modicisalibacter]MBZ9568908.1 hypothetical protein [Modicisalibacter tunisiensis]